MIVSISIANGGVTGVAVYPERLVAKAEQHAVALVHPGAQIDEVQLWNVPSMNGHQVATVHKVFHVESWHARAAVERAKDHFVPDRLRHR